MVREVYGVHLSVQEKGRLNQIHAIKRHRGTRRPETCSEGGEKIY